MGKVQLYFRYASYLFFCNHEFLTFFPDKGLDLLSSPHNTFTCNVFTSPVRRLEEFLQILVTSEGKKRKSL